MDLKLILNFLFVNLAKSLVINNVNDTVHENPDNVFSGVYTECFLVLSYSCLQKKTLLYLKELNNLSEVSVIGDYVKFVKINETMRYDDDDSETGNTDELAFLIDKAVDDFFDNHVLKFNALGRDIAIPRNIGEFVGRKKRKGGGGGSMDMMGGHGHDDKKKMMMMAMMCMKMKLMMMVPAMMGMMGMMSFKGMMFSMMSFMLSKMMLLMKILERKGGAGGLGAGGSGGDGGWSAAGGGGGAWMPAGGQDFGGGGYDANGQWQSRAIDETLDLLNKPITSRNSNQELYIPYTPFKDYKIDDSQTLDLGVTNLRNRAINNRNNNYEIKTPYTLNSDLKKVDIEPYKPVLESPEFKAMPEISYVKPTVRFNNKIEKDVYKKPVLVYKKSNVDFNFDRDANTEMNDKESKSADIHLRAKRSISVMKETKSNNINGKRQNSKINPNEYSNPKPKDIKETPRKKRSLIDLLQNSYAYWINTLFGSNNNRRTNLSKFKIINGVRYVYYPFKTQKYKTPKEIQQTSNIQTEESGPIITAEDFNKGEIMEGSVEPRMQRKKFNKMKDEVNETLDDDPWQ